MSIFSVHESDHFLDDVESAAIWLLENNLETSPSFAVQKVEELQAEIDTLKDRLKKFPESGESDQVMGLRKFPIYGGRYSAKWIVQRSVSIVTMIALTDSKYPKTQRTVQLPDDM